MSTHFSKTRMLGKHEEELLLQGIKDTDVDKKYIDEFLYNECTERTIEVFANGEGQINYYLFMLGTFIGVFFL